MNKSISCMCSLACIYSEERHSDFNHQHLCAKGRWAQPSQCSGLPSSQVHSNIGASDLHFCPLPCRCSCICSTLFGAHTQGVRPLFSDKAMSDAMSHAGATASSDGNTPTVLARTQPVDIKSSASVLSSACSAVGTPRMPPYTCYKLAHARFAVPTNTKPAHPQPPSLLLASTTHAEQRSQQEGCRHSPREIMPHAQGSLPQQLAPKRGYSRAACQQCHAQAPLPQRCATRRQPAQPAPHTTKPGPAEGILPPLQPAPD